MAHVIVQDLSKAFGGAPLYSGFDLDIPEGEVVALMGPSGVGKSTLLRIIAGIDRAYHGSVTVDGVPAADAPAPGFMFQDARLLPWLTVAQNLRLARPALTDDELATRLAAVGLDGTAAQFPAELSGGMQRRAALARAVLANPRLLLLDEPFASLDQALLDDMLALVGKTLSETKATALIATHRPDEAARLAHRVLVLTGRPVTVAADIRLTGEPAERSRAEIEDLTQSLSQGEIR
jgi:ABC-type nitrate/sulfonate/bicarbonate transport system ATPase subunit